jgi:nucleotide-binding universal stress UspA family protein
MAFKNLLVHLDDRKSCAGRVAAAVTLAEAHGAHLAGLYIAADPILPANLRAEAPPEYVRMLWDQQKEAMAEAERRFKETLRKAGLKGECRTAHMPSSLVPSTISMHARYADLVLLGQPEPDARGEYQSSNAEDVIMASGRPALVVPYIGAGETLGRRIMIAWDGGREAARAVADAMPLLEAADRVGVCVINPKSGNHGAEPGADIALHLARHGIKVEVQHLEVRDMSVADTILSRMADQDIDLLVMGAYGHSRIREWVLGGTTRQIFAQMTVPVLMSH